jgi:hypothetical protein
LRPWPSGKRAGVVGIGAAVVLAAVFWIFVFPHTGFKRYIAKTQLSWILKGIASPPDTITLGINAQSGLGIPGTDDVSFASGSYMTNQDFDAVKKHYLLEFPRHKFVFKSESKNDRGTVGITFCRTGYQANLTLTNGPRVQGMRIYDILLVNSAGIQC